METILDYLEIKTHRCHMISPFSRSASQHHEGLSHALKSTGTGKKRTCGLKEEYPRPVAESTLEYLRDKTWARVN